MAAPMKTVHIPHLGRTVILVDREKMRRKGVRRYFQNGTGTPPAYTDWSLGETIQYPMLGNDTEGDCYYAAILHMVQTFMGQRGEEPNWNASAVLKRYEQLSGGDNGLSDSDVYPEWKAGILGPDGPNKILDDLLVNPDDTAALDMAIWRFQGVLLTVSLPGNWADSAGPGVTWTTPISSFVGGHAIVLTGKNAKGGYDLRTWGISPPINVTQKGFMACDPEIIVVFSAEQFDPATGLDPNGFTWEEQRALWMQWGGKDVGPSPFSPTPNPTPTPTPVPTPTPTPSTLTLAASPNTGTSPLSVSFSAVGLDTTKTYLLDFGDQTNTMSLPASHTYTSDGDYIAHLTQGANEVSASVHVGTPTPSPVPVPNPTPSPAPVSFPIYNVTLKEEGILGGKTFTGTATPQENEDDALGKLRDVKARLTPQQWANIEQFLQFLITILGPIIGGGGTPPPSADLAALIAKK